MKYLWLLTLLCTRTALAADGEFRLGLGMALNNNDPQREDVHTECWYKGSLLDASAVWHNAVGGADAKLSWTYMSCSDFGTEQFVTLSFLGKRGGWRFGGGLIINYTQGYENWQREYIPPDPIGPRECAFCGVAIEIDYCHGRWCAEAQYLRTDFNMYPGHNGSSVKITCGL